MCTHLLQKLFTWVFLRSSIWCFGCVHDGVAMLDLIRFVPNLHAFADPTDDMPPRRLFEIPHVKNYRILKRNYDVVAKGVKIVAKHYLHPFEIMERVPYIHLPSTSGQANQKTWYLAKLLDKLHGPDDLIESISRILDTDFELKQWFSKSFDSRDLRILALDEIRYAAETNPEFRERFEEFIVEQYFSPARRVFLQRVIGNYEENAIDIPVNTLENYICMMMLSGRHSDQMYQIREEIQQANEHVIVEKTTQYMSPDLLLVQSLATVLCRPIIQVFVDRHVREHSDSKVETKLIVVHPWGENIDGVMPICVAAIDSSFFPLLCRHSKQRNVKGFQYLHQLTHRLENLQSLPSREETLGNAEGTLFIATYPHLNGRKWTVQGKIEKAGTTFVQAIVEAIQLDPNVFKLHLSSHDIKDLVLSALMSGTTTWPKNTADLDVIVQKHLQPAHGMQTYLMPHSIYRQVKAQSKKLVQARLRIATLRRALELDAATLEGIPDVMQVETSFTLDDEWMRSECYSLVAYENVLKEEDASCFIYFRYIPRTWLGLPSARCSSTLILPTAQEVYQLPVSRIKWFTTQLEALAPQAEEYEAMRGDIFHEVVRSQHAHELEPIASWSKFVKLIGWDEKNKPSAYVVFRHDIMTDRIHEERWHPEPTIASNVLAEALPLILNRPVVWVTYLKGRTTRLGSQDFSSVVHAYWPGALGYYGNENPTLCIVEQSVENDEYGKRFYAVRCQSKEATSHLEVESVKRSKRRETSY